MSPMDQENATPRVERRAIVRQAIPLLMAQLASVGMMVIDSILLGHYGALDLAAIAVGGGIYISVLMALVGILQSLGPIAAHHVGAGQRRAAVGAFWQGVWLAVLLALPGVLLLCWPDSVLSLSRLEPAVDALVRQVLRLLALGLPAALLYRTFAAFANALGRSRVLMVVSFSATAVHAVVAFSLVNGYLFWPPLGALGCAISTALINIWCLLLAGLYLARGRGMRELAVFRHFAWPRWSHFGEFFRLGLPMGFSNFVEITSFTLIALLVAPLGATVVSGHRIVGNLAAIAYMIPLSIAIATLSRVGQAAGARDPARCRAAARAGSRLAMGAALLVGALIFLLGPWLLAGFTDQRAVLAAALPLLGFVALYQVFDAWQTVAAYALRGLKVTLAPMLIHVVAFWGIGLAGGWWLSYSRGMGLPGFWLASVLSTVAAALAFALMLRRAMRLRQTEWTGA
ncbi:MAG TPA: MATE family efflux transporter [Rhodocyclaceae bacterium]|nr:MATE family efflux transporter [Rhodocyclaceae bacterium]